MIDIKIIGALFLAVITGAAGYLYGKSKCSERHQRPPGMGQGGIHPQMFRKREQ